MHTGEKIFTSKQLREIDKYTIENEPIASIDLMERAALKITKWICKKFKKTNHFKIFAGPGNNGGDALALARLLYKKKYKVSAYILKIKPQLSADAEINYKRLIDYPQIPIQFLESESDFPHLKSSEVIIEGLFGSGLARPLDNIAALLVQNINDSKSTVISIDIPSGLFDVDNKKNNYNNIINASYTLSLQVPKLSFFFSENEKKVGKWVVLPIGLHPTAIKNTQTGFYYWQKKINRKNIKHRSKFTHKGKFGHALLISGSFGKIGAAILSARAALRTGVGLLTTYTPKCGYEIIQTAVPEAMSLCDKNSDFITHMTELEHFNAIGIGPGIGQNNETIKFMNEFLKNVKCPLVIDADALNIISNNDVLKKLIPENSILTPHPKEFERLMNKKAKNSLERLNQQIEFAKHYKCIVVLKGAHTSIVMPNGDCYFNTTGNPGMATAGSGDVLTGIILGLLAQNYNHKDASLIGVYAHGLAGDFSVKKIGEQGLIASDIIRFLPKVWK